MGLIYGKKIPLLRKGYPTVSDKYNVAGGRFEGTAPLEVGSLMEYGSESGLFKAATDASKVCGIALASNVKLTNSWNVTEVKTVIMPGEAANLCFHGYVAVKVGEHTTAEADKAITDLIVPGAACGFANGAVSTNTTTVLPGFYFTGVFDIVGGEILAEVQIAEVKVAAE